MSRTQPAEIPAGTWPKRMPAKLAAGYCGEASAQSFMKAWKRGEYPDPRVNTGRRKLWLIDDLNQTLDPRRNVAARDVALDL